jgi:hypothetical protein
VEVREDGSEEGIGASDHFRGIRFNFSAKAVFYVGIGFD